MGVTISCYHPKSRVGRSGSIVMHVMEGTMIFAGSATTTGQLPQIKGAVGEGSGI